MALPLNPDAGLLLIALKRIENIIKTLKNFCMKVHSMFSINPGEPAKDGKKPMLAYIDIETYGSNTKKRILIAEKLGKKLKDINAEDGFFADFEEMKKDQFMLFPASKGIDNRLLFIGAFQLRNPKLGFCEIVESNGITVKWENPTPKGIGMITIFEKPGAYFILNDWTVVRFYKGYAIVRECSSGEQADEYLKNNPI